MKRLSIVLFILVITATIVWGISRGIGQVKNNFSNKGKWTGAWTASMQAPLSDGISQEGFKNETIRMIIQPHIDGGKVRMRLSNKFASEPLKIDQVCIAESVNRDQIKKDSDHIVTFDGKKKVEIPPGEKKVSDPVSIKVNSDKPLAVSVYVRGASGPVGWHPHAMQTNYIVKGNQAASAELSAQKKKEKSWFLLEAVDVKADKTVKGAVVVLGSSIANGNHSTPDANHRWPDYLAKRMKASGHPMSVLNAGISASQLIESTPDKGEGASERIERDVFDQTGIKSVILHQGLNDIRHHPEYSAGDIIDKMKEIIKKTHDRGLKIYGGTLTPYKGSGMFTPEGEKTRQEVNDWIRNSGEFDGVIDFDKAVRDPEDPERYLPDYDAGDHLHPNDAGYEKMADAVDLSMFK
ncbi:SGNH/GDSL hydrolase family protein [[Bacillus] enclensis]|uniref:SGNH/GDSL hydrolase family protein n=1 Tax=[Bacillus] enclensis TaxID=1402860 RepID=UPI0018DB1B0B|nr:SGNH/GDSL hydrolase family protein [[Bacillus] enclensis]MBH9968867.1 SGNH/GDSL hydrolase family protein [[Bacillus] enclensis]